MKILVIDVGGSHVKLKLTGQQSRRSVPSGQGMTAADMVEAVRALAWGWEYEAVSLGFPGSVGLQGPREEPANLGPGWVGFDFAAAFGCPVKVFNDAAMQALGSYEGGRMLFLGLGTGLGSTLVAERVLVPLELGEMPWKEGRTLAEQLGKEGLKRLGKAAWQRTLEQAVAALKAMLVADYVVLGGGEAHTVDLVPPGCRRGDNENAFVVGFRLWRMDELAPPNEWRVI